ncbi:hypothetical protein D9M69_645740 [compost metagenome]
MAQVRGLGVQAVEAAPQLGFGGLAFSDLLAARLGEAGALGAQKQVGQPALALQAVDQPAGHVHQRAGERELAQRVDLAALGGDEEIEARFQGLGGGGHARKGAAIFVPHFAADRPRLVRARELCQP